MQRSFFMFTYLTRTNESAIALQKTWGRSSTGKSACLASRKLWVRVPSTPSNSSRVGVARNLLHLWRLTHESCYSGCELLLRTFQAIVKQGKIELLEPVELQEGAQVLVTLVSENEDYCDAWSEQDCRDLTAFSLQHADNRYPESEEISKCPR